MFGIDRRTLYILWTALLFLLVAFVVYETRRTLVIFTLALFFSHLLAPVIAFIERGVPKKLPHSVTIAIVYCVFLAILIAALIPVTSRIAQEAATLASFLNTAVQQGDPLSRIPFPPWLEPVRPRVTDVLRARLNELDKDVLPILSTAGSHIIAGLGNVFSAILIPILSFFFLKDGPAMREAIVHLSPPSQRTFIGGVLEDLHFLLAHYIRALVILSVATFVFFSGYLSITKVPYAVLLGGIAAILEFIPVVGPLLGAAVILLVAAVTGYPHLLWILIFLVIYRLFQDYVLSPYLMSSGVEVHPLLVLFGVLAGEELAGIPGMFFSVPVIAALRVLLVRVRRRAHAA